MSEIEALRGEMASGFAAVHNRLDDIQSEVSEVKAEAKHTNGRVRDIELWKAEARGSMRTILFILTLPGVAAAIAAVVMVLR